MLLSRWRELMIGRWLSQRYNITMSEAKNLSGKIVTKGGAYSPPGPIAHIPTPKPNKPTSPKPKS